MGKNNQFYFGSNWENYLKTPDEDKIRGAEDSLRSMLEILELSGENFLDVGCGSGLMSLAAKRLGARVYSFDFDPGCIASIQAKGFSLLKLKTVSGWGCNEFIFQRRGKDQ